MSKSFEDKVNENHIVFIHSGLGADGTNKAILNIMQWSKASKDIEINLYVSAASWDYVNTMALYDILSNIENPVAVYCMGYVGGYSTVLLAAASKGKRYALKHTTISLNQPYGSIQSGANQQTEVEIEANEISKERKDYEEILAKSLNKPLDEIHQRVEIDQEFSAQEAKEYGLIDEVLE